MDFDFTRLKHYIVMFKKGEISREKFITLMGYEQKYQKITVYKYFKAFR